MRARRLFPVLLVLGIVFVVRRRERAEADREPAASTEPYRATAQEGLGASVAILLDNSGSMEDAPESGGDSSKAVIARDVIRRVLSQTDSFAVQQPGFPVNVGLYVFARRVQTVLPMGPWSAARLDSALASVPAPDGGTAIGRAMQAAIADLYGAGTIRKYILVITDGENNEGANPADVAQEIARRSDGAVRLFLVAFDVTGEKFGFVPAVSGTLVEARNASGLRASLDTLYRGRILAEAVDAGETAPDTVRRP